MALINPVRGAPTHAFVSAQSAFLKLVPDLKVGAGQQIRPLAFIKLMGFILSFGIALLLIINMALTQDAFTLSQLERHALEISAQEQAITQIAARESSPQMLASKAVALGMKPGVNQDPVFIDLVGGRVLGGSQKASLP